MVYEGDDFLAFRDDFLLCEFHEKIQADYCEK